jgi:hypothetical protein
MECITCRAQKVFLLYNSKVMTIVTETKFATFRKESGLHDE